MVILLRLCWVSSLLTVSSFKKTVVNWLLMGWNSTLRPSTASLSACLNCVITVKCSIPWPPLEYVRCKLQPRKRVGKCHIPLHLTTSGSALNMLGLVMSACLCLDRGTVPSADHYGTGSWPTTPIMMSPRRSNFFFACSAMFHVTLNTSPIW